MQDRGDGNALPNLNGEALPFSFFSTKATFGSPAPIEVGEIIFIVIKEKNQMELKRFIYTVKSMLWLIIVLGVIGGGIAEYASMHLLTHQYQAETTIYALNKNAADGSVGIDYQSVMLSRQLVQDYQEIMTSEKVLALAEVHMQKYSISQDELKKMIKVIPKIDSSVIGISAVADDPKIAAEASLEVTRAFMIRLRELTNGNIVGVIDEAKIPEKPVNDNRVKNIILGALSGIISAFAIIYLKELFDSTVKFSEEIERIAHIKVLGIIPEYGIK